jgi:hypothetical protein
LSGQATKDEESFRRQGTDEPGILELPELRMQYFAVGIVTEKGCYEVALGIDPASQATPWRNEYMNGEGDDNSHVG